MEITPNSASNPSGPSSKFISTNFHCFPVVSGYLGRILTDIPCKVCQDHSSGKHYGIYACDGCAGFFKRSIRRNRQYTCKLRNGGVCAINKVNRNQCRECRLKKCFEVGMNKEAVQHERGPRNSTLRRQMALFIKDNQEGAADEIVSTRSKPDAFSDQGVSASDERSSSPSSSDSSFDRRRSRDVAQDQQLNSSSDANANINLRAADLLATQSTPALFDSPFHHQGSPSFNDRVSSLLISNMLQAANVQAAATSLLGNQFNHKLSIPAKDVKPHDSLVAAANSLSNPITSFMLASLFSGQSPLAMFPPAAAPPAAPVSPPSESTSTANNNTITNGAVTSVTPTSTPTSLDSFYEQAARVLFLCVKWTKVLPSFTNLKETQQIALLENSWSELFLLIACEMQLTVDWQAVSKYYLVHEKSAEILSALCRCQDVFNQFRNMAVDTTEYACLKAISLFKTPARSSLQMPFCTSANSELSQLREDDLLEAISTMQDQAQTTLQQYENMLHPAEKSRFGKLLLLLPLLNTINQEMVEEIFFKRVVGGVAVSKLIGHIFRRQSIL
uniref:TllA n=1 Tax=Stenostomum brevipharyngium TaxID=2880247 RepID=A0AA51BM44_9PLAT|nr:TllA [Stenostomum brevipharyngium]